jgi:hypothetical protein
MIPKFDTMRVGNSVREVGGIVLRLSGRYICWNSFKSCFYLGKFSNSEIFPWLLFNQKNKMLDRARAEFPNAVEVLIGA